MAVDRYALTVGQKLLVPAFTVTVVDTDSEGVLNCIRVSDDTGSKHFIYPNRLSMPVPYEDGALYVTAYNDCFVYKAADDGISRGKWLAVSSLGYDEDDYDDSDLISYDSPYRPLRKVIVGAELND